MPGSVLQVRGLGMTFPGTRALVDVNMEVKQGEVHGLVGHNGSGKSTLIKVISGVHRPDAGSSVELGGESLPWEAPTESERLGLRVVHQNLGLVNSMTVTENVNLGSGYSSRRFSPIAWRRENQRAGEEMARLGYDVNPKSKVGELPAATRSAVAIARALSPKKDGRTPRILLLDEVTATMPEGEIERLLELVNTLKHQGISVLYVSHHLEEVLKVCDTVTVLKDGRLVVTTPARTLTMTSLADFVVGSSEWRERAADDPGTSGGREIDGLDDETRLDVTNLAGALLRDLSFSAGPGRIVGISGITGSGREEVAQLLLGALPRDGSVRVGGALLPTGNPRRSVQKGVTLVPAERMRSAVVPTQNVRENLTLSSLRRRRPLGLLTARQERPLVRDWIARLTIRGATPEGSINTLSGGNQQKVILARSLSVKPKVLLLDEPTQGVDVGAVADIHARIREISRSSSVVVCSSDSYELATLCAEVIVLQRGREVGRLFGKDITEANLDHLQLATLAGNQSPEAPQNDKED